MYVYEFDWSPDSKELAYLAAPGDGDDNWYVAQLYAINAESGAVRHVFKPAMQAANVRWSPDGKTIAFIGGLMSDEGVIGRRHLCTAGRGRSGARSDAGSQGVAELVPLVAVVEADYHDGRHFRENPRSRRWIRPREALETLWKGAESVSFSGDTATSAVVRSSFDHPPEVWAGATGKWQQVTHSNDALPGAEDARQRGWGEGKSIDLEER